MKELKVSILADGILFPSDNLAVWWDADGEVKAANWSEYGMCSQASLHRRHGDPEELGVLVFLSRIAPTAHVRWFGSGTTRSRRFGGDFSRAALGGREGCFAAELLTDLKRGEQ